MAEGISGELTFGEGSGAAYWRVFEYLYTGDYSESLPTNGLQGKLPITSWAVIYITAARRSDFTKRSSRIRTCRYVLSRALESAI